MEDVKPPRPMSPTSSRLGPTPASGSEGTPVAPAASGSTTAHSLGPELAELRRLRERARAPRVISPILPVTPASPAASDIPKREDTPSIDTIAPPPPTTSSKGKQRATEDEEDEPVEGEAQSDTANENPFACHICLEVPAADDAVLSKCGHLFCWSDLSAWLESNPPASSQCPVCKSQIINIQEDVIPIYSGGVEGKKQVDPRTKPRPRPNVLPAPAAVQRGGGFFGGGSPPGPLWDLGAPAAGPGGWNIQAGVFPFPGLTFGWSNAQQQYPGAAHMAARGGTALYNGVPVGAPMSPEMQEAARRQQRNALIAFVVMILLFSLLATVGEMELD